MGHFLRMGVRCLAIVGAPWLWAGSLERAQLEKAATFVDAKRILENVKTISADEMEGRGTGTAGEKKAVEWLAAQYKSFGLKPLGPDYFQKVRLIGYKRKPNAVFSLLGPKGALELKAEENLTFWSTSQQEKVSIQDAALVFVGYGVEAKEHQWDDFKGIDCKGKVLVFLNNDPAIADDPEAFGGKRRTYYGRWIYKFEQAMRHGAIGALVIHTQDSAGYGWQVPQHNGEHESFALDLSGAGYQIPLVGWLRQDLAEQLAESVGQTVATWFEAANKRDFKPVSLPFKANAQIEVALRKVAAINVVAVWEGSDPKLKDEVVLFSAHHDHLGLAESGEDKVFNGAWDNGLGSVSILEIAHALSESGLRPKRSIAFLNCTAEEKGLLGSQWFANNPTLPLEKIVGNINVDMPQLFGLTRDISAIGYESNELGRFLQEVAARTMVGQGDAAKALQVVGDKHPNAGSFYRSDQVNFAKRGIPAIYMQPGGNYLTAPTTDIEVYHDTHYHQLIDEVNEHWDLSGCARDMGVALQVALIAADRDALPQWQAGNEFEAAWNKLHGK